MYFQKKIQIFSYSFDTIEVYNFESNARLIMSYFIIKQDNALAVFLKDNLKCKNVIDNLLF